MIAKQINRRKNSVSSFPRLFKYLTTELDPDTGARRKRCTNRDIVWSENNLGFLDTAAYEMQGIAFLNVRCKDALYYYILSWPPGEVPARTHWHDAIQHTLASLGFAEHQYVAVALKKAAHLSGVHIMVNRVHPETFKAHTPSWSYCALSIACRELEAKYGWQPTRGIFRWDDLTQTVVRIPPHLRSSYSNKEPVQVPTDTALDRCSTRATLLAYLRHHLALRVRTLLLRNHATWADLHSLLAEHQLRFERRRGCTYTIFNPQHNVRVKASDVFLHNFGGEHARRLTERQLGPWAEM
jgi:hypothetical protein